MAKKIIIIGAGPAGLTAGYELLKQNPGYDVEILEESQEVGGISRTVKHNGNRMDIGGHRFFSKNEQVMDWWFDKLPLQGSQSFDDIELNRQKEISQNGPNPETEDIVMLKRNRISRIFYMHKFFDYPISMKPQTFINMGFKKTMESGFSYLASMVHKRPENSLEDFYINRFGKALYSMFFEGYTEKLWGRHPREIAPDWGSQRVKGLSIITLIKDTFSKMANKGGSGETSLIEEFYYPKYGPGQLWEKVADDFEKMGGTITKSACVNGLEKDENGNITKILIDDNGKEISKSADVVISSMPVKDLVESMKWDVPEKVKSTALGLPYRDFVTVGLLFDKLKIKNETDIKTLNNIVPDCWIYVQDTGVKLGRIQVFNNWSPYLVSDAHNKIWIGLEYFCTENDSFWNMSEEECTKYAYNELVKMGVIENGAKVYDSHREKIKKAYPAYFDTYKDIDCVVNYLNGIDNLYCIGRNGQHRYNNMDHSMLTAFEAVNNIVSGNSSKDNLWNVNTEKEYHESK